MADDADSGAPPARWARVAGVLDRRSGDRVLVLPPGRGEPLLLSGSAATVWLALSAPSTAADLLRVGGATAGAVDDALATLADVGLVVTGS